MKRSFFVVGGIIFVCVFPFFPNLKAQQKFPANDFGNKTHNLSILQRDFEKKILIKK